MKSILFVCLLMLSYGTLAKKVVCATNNDAKPYDTFIFDVSEEKVSISYMRQPFYGAELMPLVQPVRGCAPVQTFMFEGRGFVGEELYYECDGDGDAGFGTVTFVHGSPKSFAKINFPEGNIGYKEGTELTLLCN